MIALTTYADDESVLDVLRAGARGYLTKDASSEDIRTAILTVAADAALDPAVQHHLVAALAGDAHGRRNRPAAGGATRPNELTPREAEVLALIAEGADEHRDACRTGVATPPG